MSAKPAGSIIERTKAALRRLGTHACNTCGALMPGIPGDKCDECKAAEIREAIKKSRSLVERDTEAVADLISGGSNQEYLAATAEYGDLIDESMGEWKIGSGIVGKRGRD